MATKLMPDLLATVAVQYDPLSDGWWTVFTICVAVLYFAGLWQVFKKAGQPGWASIVPIYNVVVIVRITNRPLWWMLFLIIPLVNVVVWFVINLNLSWRFGKDFAFAVGLTFLGFVFISMLGFGDAQYRPGLGPPSDDQHYPD